MTWSQVLPRTIQQLQFLFPLVHINTIHRQEIRQIGFIVSQWQIIFQVTWKRHITTLNKSSDWSSGFATACSGGTFDWLFPIPVEYNIYPLILWTCFQYCTNVCVSHMSKGRCIVRFSQSYHECLSIDDKARWCFLKFNSFRADYACWNQLLP